MKLSGMNVEPTSFLYDSRSRYKCQAFRSKRLKMVMAPEDQKVFVGLDLCGQGDSL